jgi:hypothetical protein
MLFAEKYSTSPCMQQPQRTAVVSLAKIEREAVRLGEALKLRELEIAEVVMRQQIGKNVVAMLVPRAGGRLGVAADDNFELRIRRVRGEIFVGINVTSAG